MWLLSDPFDSESFSRDVLESTCLTSTCDPYAHQCLELIILTSDITTGTPKYYWTKPPSGFFVDVCILTMLYGAAPPMKTSTLTFSFCFFLLFTSLVYWTMGLHTGLLALTPYEWPNTPSPGGCSGLAFHPSDPHTMTQLRDKIRPYAVE